MRQAIAFLAVLMVLAGCDDMTHQPRQKTYTPEVAPAQLPKDIVEYGKTPQPPPPVTLALLDRGQEQFRIYCTPCHSELGDGDGMIVQRGFPHPPSYHSAALLEAPTRHFYDVITNGFGVMYSYAARVQPADRWAIAAYIRALQLSQRIPVADLSAEQRKLLP
ncbi:MAG: cytochrome c [Acetobacteraceae bacterium]